MPYSPPQPRDLFDGSPSEQVKQFEALKDVLKACVAKGYAQAQSGDVQFIPKVGLTKSGRSQAIDSLKALAPAELQKAGITPDLVKEWELGSPIAQTPISYTGYTPYEVEPAVLMIVPKELKLRNKTARVKWSGQGFEYRRVTGVSNSTTANQLSPFFSSVANTASFNGVTLNRPPLISYSGDATFKPFVEMGFSDSVSLQQQFAGQGFTDVRALSALSLIWAHVLGEERALLNSRASALPITSAGGTAADDTTVTGSGLPAATATAVYATFSSSFGESRAITLSGTPTTSAGDGIKITSLVNVPAGTLAINIYADYSSTYYKGSTVLTTGASPLTFATVTALPSTAADNGSYPNYTFGGNLVQGATSNTILGYDGAVTEYSNASLAGYTTSLNAALNSDSPGIEFETALVNLYVQQGADPDDILTTGSIMQTLWELFKSASSNNNYRVNLVSGDGGITAGGAVTGIVNPATSKSVNISTHRYMKPGVALIMSNTVPWPDSNVTACMKVANVVDTMVIDWPQIGMSYDQSTYTYGTCVFEAPILSGTILNILD